MRISVIVPVRNEEKTIGLLLEGLLKQSRRPEEIVITDGGSTDTSASIINNYIQAGAPVRLIRSGPALPGRARNLAATMATGDWLAFIDAGVQPECSWLESLAGAAASDGKVQVIYGSFRPITDTLFKECAAMAYLPPPKEVDGAFIRPRSIASALMRREVWEAVGGFPEDLRSAEDLLFMNKVEEAGYRTGQAPEAMVHWNLQPDMGSTFRRFVVYARNNLRAGLGRHWQRPILKRYALLLLLALPIFVFGYWWLLITLMLWILMLSARGLVSIWRNRFYYPATAGRNLRRLLVLIPLIAVLDSAALVGSIQWLLSDRLGLAGGAVSVGHET